MDFDFITDEEFRASLVADYRELQSSIEQRSWKAAHVLAGSIVEAILIEHIVVSKLCTTGQDPLRMDLSDGIEVCKTAGVIQADTANLCNVIRGYRNLIHPGRVIRLKQEVTAESANIAIHLVAIIGREVAAKRSLTYGATAEQIVKKLKRDEHSLAVLPHLLTEMNDYERAKLVKKALPEAYFQDASLLTSDFDFIANEDHLNRFASAYQQALTLLSAAEQRRVAEQFAKLVREDSTEKIQQYSDTFFSAEQIAHLNESDANLVTTYLIARLDDSSSVLTDEITGTMAGIANYVGETDFDKFVDTLVRLVLRQPEDRAQRAIKFVGQVFDKADETRQRRMESRIATWIKRGKQRGLSAAAQKRLDAIENQWIVVPF